MKPGAAFIDTSRGDVIDEATLVGPLEPIYAGNARWEDGGQRQAPRLS